MVSQLPYWRDRADELRALTENLKDPTAKAMILGCARDYDLLAQRAEERLKSPKKYKLRLYESITLCEIHPFYAAVAGSVFEIECAQ